MSKSKPQQNNWFGWLAAGAILVAAGAITAFRPTVTTYAHERAAAIADAANNGRIDLATGYEVASRLDPTNQEYPVALATHYLDARRPQDALMTLLEHQGHDIALARSRALIEQGRGGGEITSPNSEALALQQATWLAINGHAAELANLKPLVQTEAGERSLSRIAAGGTALANELLARHMPLAAIQVLDTAPERSVSRFTALGTLLLADAGNKREQLNKASQAASEALAIDPSSIDAHELLRRVLIAGGQREEANREAQIIEALRLGRF